MCDGEKKITKCDYFANEGSIGNLFKNLILQLLSCPAIPLLSNKFSQFLALFTSNLEIVQAMKSMQNYNKYSNK